MKNFPYPNITGRTSEEKIDQIVSYLRRLVDELNYEAPDGQTAQEIRELGDQVAAIQQTLGMNTK